MLNLFFVSFAVCFIRGWTFFYRIQLQGFVAIPVT